MRIVFSLAIASICATGSAAADEWTKTIPERIKQSLYPAVLAADWADGSNTGLWLFVVDNGKNRDGLATSACSSLQFYKDVPKGTFVVIRVYDAMTASAGQGSKQLGKANCSI